MLCIYIFTSFSLPYILFLYIIYSCIYSCKLSIQSILVYFQWAKYEREPTTAEVFRVTHVVEHTDENGNVSYDWLEDKATSVMVNMFISVMKIFHIRLFHNK